MYRVLSIEITGNMKFYPLAKPHIDEKDKKGVLKVLDSGVLALGPNIELFEKNIAKYVGTKFGCAVSNGTCGLHLAVKAIGLQPGDEVITTPFSFISSSNCLLFEGVKPVFVDIETTTFNMDPDKIEAAITPKTKAILVVHIFGQSAEMKPILKIAKKYKLKIIEDACESLGSTYFDKQTGSLGDVSVFAFYPNKQMTTGEGGMIVTNSQKIQDECRSLRNQGRNTQGDWLIHVQMGYNYRIDEMSASLGVTQLAKLDWMIKEKQKIASWYNKHLANHQHILTPLLGKNRTHSWFVYVIRVTNGKRNYLMEELGKNHIHTKPYLPVIHLQPFMKKQFGFKKGMFPQAETVSSQSLALPFYIGLTEKDVITIASQIKKFV